MGPSSYTWTQRPRNYFLGNWNALRMGKCKYINRKKNKNLWGAYQSTTNPKIMAFVSLPPWTQVMQLSPSLKIAGGIFHGVLIKISVREVSVGNDNFISIIACRSTHISLLEVVYHLSEFPSLRESRVLGLGPRDWKKAGFAKELSPEGRVQLLLWGGRSAATAAAAGGSGAGAGRTGSQHDLVQKDERRKTWGESNCN